MLAPALPCAASSRACLVVAARLAAPALAAASPDTANLAGEQPCGGQSFLRPGPTSAGKRTIATRIDLWVGKAIFEPLKAKLDVQTGKLAQRASVVTDKARAAPAAWSNPQQLAAKPSLK